MPGRESAQRPRRLPRLHSGSADQTACSAWGRRRIPRRTTGYPLRAICLSERRLRPAFFRQRSYPHSSRWHAHADIAGLRHKPYPEGLCRMCIPPSRTHAQRHPHAAAVSRRVLSPSRAPSFRPSVPGAGSCCGSLLQVSRRMPSLDTPFLLAEIGSFGSSIENIFIGTAST